MSETIQILVVEDNSSDAELLVRELRRTGLDFIWERVDTEVEFLAKLNPKLNLILSDFEMPEFSGIRALELLNQRHDLEIPFIIVSGTIGEELAVAAMREGAADYLLKDRIGRLAPAVHRALREVKDRAERKQLQAQFLEAQKMEIVGQLAGGVAHDFNNVLAVIMGYSEVVIGELGTDHPLHNHVEEIRLAALRAAGLTRQLLIFSRKETVKAVELNLNEVIEDMEKMLRQLINENIELTMVYDKEPGLIKADAGYVWQVLMNLVVNARDAMPEGGKLAIKTCAVTLDESCVKTHQGVSPGDYMMISVSDTGVGMTDEVKSRLFEAFFTTKAAGKGTGLGLVTCHTVVQQSGGHIDVSSELGQGTTFKVYFPSVGHSTRAITRSLPKISPLKRGTETLLVVEDEPALRHLAQGVLKAQGYQVLTAPNGQDALRVADEHRGDPIALVVTDVIMPRMGGKAMAEWLQTTSPDLKVLFTSGYTEDDVSHDGVLDEGIQFLPKPYTATSLARKVRELLDSTK
jgi:two-component system, cell cycle sensor histidine kinase and response regulator CckA